MPSTKPLAIVTGASSGIGLPDGGVEPRRGALTRALRGILAPGDTLFTHWRGDAHPDHEAVAGAAVEASESLGIRLLEFPVWAWHWSFPGDARMPWPRALRLQADSDSAIRKAHALRCFASQIEPDLTTGRGPIVPASALARARALPEVFFA